MGLIVKGPSIPREESIFPVILQLVVEATHLKNMRKSNWIIFLNFRGEN